MAHSAINAPDFQAVSLAAFKIKMRCKRQKVTPLFDICDFGSVFPWNVS